ncbi:hypothetical protein PRIPAC_88070 [Pristionchus pacificus]|uniref:Ion channel n=1 Tax=Pristionchus pacificus TaxID=54126 RepID=A0A2A6B8E7_PRIPA|nr:hypothetical protein PRIPAC_88070 [Pristionchus pacificus]|eukprot:PDM62137.1 ion channel [Pristionchus pacificus]
MCLTNRQAVRLIIWIKHAYQKYHLSHLLLLLSYTAFILLSTTAFFLTESIQAKTYRSRHLASMSADRNKFVHRQLFPRLFNNSFLLIYANPQKSSALMGIMNEQLENYEQYLRLRPPLHTIPHTFGGSLLFVFSSITTLGSASYPATPAGRVLSMLIAAIGIPFTIIVIKDLSFLLAKLFYFPCTWLEACWAAFRFCTLRGESEQNLETRFHSLHDYRTRKRDYRLAHSERMLSIPVAIAIFALIGWATLGTVIVRWHVPHLNATVAFYHVFNCLTTTGVRHIELREDPLPLLALISYTLIGLAVLSLFAYWLPGRMRMQQQQPHLKSASLLSPALLASFDSDDDDDHLTDVPVNHFTTLGILQTDDKCPLICLARRQHAYTDAVTQTGSAPMGLVPKRRFMTPDAVFIDNSQHRLSLDNVDDLIVETYSKRSPRLAGSRSTEKPTML